MSEEPLDEALLERIMRAVKLEVRLPMRVRISKVVKGVQRDVHVLDIGVTEELAEVQKKVVCIARRWKGGFEVGTVYTVERVA